MTPEGTQSKKNVTRSNVINMKYVGRRQENTLYQKLIKSKLWLLFKLVRFTHFSPRRDSLSMNYHGHHYRHPCVRKATVPCTLPRYRWRSSTQYAKCWCPFESVPSVYGNKEHGDYVFFVRSRDLPYILRYGFRMYVYIVEQGAFSIELLK